MDEGTDGWKASFPPPTSFTICNVMLFERGYEERLRKRVQVVLVGWWHSAIPCGSKDNWGWFGWNILLQLDTLLTFFSCCCVHLHCSRLEVFLIKLWDRWVRPTHGTSSDHWNIWSLENGCKCLLTDGTHNVSPKKIEAGKSLPQYFCQNFPLI